MLPLIFQVLHTLFIQVLSVKLLTKVGLPAFTGVLVRLVAVAKNKTANKHILLLVNVLFDKTTYLLGGFLMMLLIITTAS